MISQARPQRSTDAQCSETTGGARLGDSPKIILFDKDGRDEYTGPALKAWIAYMVRVLRLQRGLTQAQAAKVCGMQQSQWARLEDMDGALPSVETLRSIARGFDVALRISFEEWGKNLRDTAQQIVRSFTEEAGK